MIIDANTIFGFWPRRNVDISIERLDEIVTGFGVSQALTASARGILYDYVGGNRETIEMAARYSWSIPVATVDPREYLGNLDEIERVRDQGVQFIRLFPEHQKWPADYLPFHRIMEKLGEYPEIVVMLPAVHGFANLVDLCKRYDNRFIVTGVMFSFLGECLEAFRFCPNFNITIELLNSVDAYETCAALGYLDRLHFGSNAPFSYFSSAYEMVTKSRLSADDKAAVLSGNMERLVR
ncbi:MAG TPA: hypothetical protein DIT01_14620 [Lentisphaeria bacterium]|nr:hypothetical protein [Lentisphaeria bacterium]|tara:strand:- start:118 stop:828 length:711 start_codon:yes stop_codon:yes gene_type:complete